MVQMTVEVNDNVLRFLKAFCNFTGETPKAIIEREIVSIPDLYLSSWDTSFGVSAEDLKKRYNL